MEFSNRDAHESTTDSPADPDLARRRLRQALDAILPDVTGDELTQSGQAHSSRTDEDYLRDRPPHHG